MYSDNKGDILTEMRFYVPNNELDMIMEEKEKEEEKKKPAKKKGSKSS